MATDATRVLVGAGTLSMGAYTSAGASGSLTDVGHTSEPITLTPAFEDFEVESERASGVIKVVPIKSNYTLVVPMLEITGEHLRIAFRQPSANLTGTSPADTLLIGTQAEQYQQISIVGPAIEGGTSRTWTFWKAAVSQVAEIPFAKAGAMVLNVTFKLLEDSSVATADKIGKMVQT